MTGPLRIRSTAKGGTISGNLTLDKGRFQLGRASAAAAVPAAPGQPPRARPRRSDRGRATCTRGSSTSMSPGSDLDVRGLGIDSRWTTDLDDRRARPTRRASPAAPTWSAAIMISPAAISGSTAASSASAAKARPTRCSTSTPRRRSRASTPACVVARHRPQARNHASPACRRCRRTNCCRGSCSAPRSPTCRRPKRCSSRSAVAALQLRLGQPRPDQRAAPRGRARPACGSCRPTSRPGRRRRSPAGKYITPQAVRRSDHRRAGLFGDARRISDHALAFVAVVGLDHRPDRARTCGVSKDY